MPDTYKLQYDGMTLTYPGWGGFLEYEYIPGPELVYLSYMTSSTNNIDNPVINKTGSTWSLGSSLTSRTNLTSVNGTMPSTYKGKNRATFGGRNISGILPISNLRKFTINAWMYSSTNGAGEFWGIRFHAAMNHKWIYLADACDFALSFNFGLNANTNFTLYEGTELGNNGCSIPTTITTKGVWSFISLYIDRDENRAEYWCDGHHILDIHSKENLFNGTQDFDQILRFIPDNNYTNFFLCELAIWNGKQLTVPTQPLV